MLVVPDNDVGGAVSALQRFLETGEWADSLADLNVRFIDFLEELGLTRNAPDQKVWETCQAAEAVLITANRTGGPNSLDETIRRQGGLSSLPVITIADPQRIFHDRAYAEGAALRLLDFLERMDLLRGAGRLFIP